MSQRKKLHHEKVYRKPMCHLCEECYFGPSKKHDGYTYYCKLTGNDVGASHIGWNSPKNCPKRKREPEEKGDKNR